MLGLLLLALQAPSTELLQPIDDLRIGGRLMSDFHFGSGDDSGEIRRARIRITGQLAPNVSFMNEYEFASDKDLKEMSVRFQDGSHRFRVGYFRQPFGLENSTSSRFHSFMEESPMSRSLGTVRAAGLAWRRVERGSAIQMGLYRSLMSETGRSQDREWSLNSRAIWRPVVSLEHEELFHVGASINLAFPDDLVEIGGRPGIRLAPEIVSSGLLDASQLLRIAGEMAWLQGAWHGSAEWMYLGAELESSGHENFNGWALASGYFLTGESRGYNLNRAVFSRTNATNAWELTARITDLDLNVRGQTGEQMLSTSVGLNHYVNPNTRIVLNWTRSDVPGQEALEFISIRFAVDW